MRVDYNRRSISKASCRSVFCLLAGVSLLLACSGSPTGPDSQDNIVEGVNLTQVFKAPSAAEIGAILDEWEGRDVSARDVQVMSTSAQTVGGTSVTVRIVAHTVDSYRHYGAVIAPPDKPIGSLPILVYSHGGDSGENLSLTLTFLPSQLATLMGEFVVVVPSFRSEPLVYGGHAYVSEGPPSPWDHDVDDALALLDAAIQVTPSADPTRIGVLGFSRGAGVGMLMAIRDPRIDAVVEFFGPTDFFGTYMQTLTEEALRDSPRDLPGLDHLNSAFIQPLKNGTITIADFRREIVRRSAVLFADHLPQLQVHHGTADSTVEFSQAESLRDTMHRIGQAEPEFEFYAYESGVHDFTTLPGSLDRAVTFLQRLRTPVLASTTRDRVMTRALP
jgi:dipeptidyl aminopeptidase/acylaminoacyl peptidase